MNDTTIGLETEQEILTHEISDEALETAGTEIAGNFTMFYDEVEDVISAAEYLRTQPYVDQRRLYVAGASTGGTLTMLAALAYPHFRAAASLSAHHCNSRRLVQ